MTQAHNTSGHVVLAVDCSTTASKAIIVDARGKTLSIGRASIDLANPGVDRYEQDADQWWTSTAAAIKEALAGIAPARVAGIAITHQRETFVCLADELPARPAMVWMDARARPQVHRLGNRDIHARTGRPADTTPSFYKIAWMSEHEPDILARSTRIGDVSAYLTFRLTGRWSSSRASADSTGMVDLATGEWDADLCRTAGIDASVLPRLVSPGDVIGEVTESAATELGLPAGIPLFAAAGDGQSAALGAGLTKPGDLYLNLGTAEVCGTLVDSYTWAPEFRTVASATGQGYLLEAFLASGTSLVNWFREEFGADVADEHGGLDRLVTETAAGSDGLIALPYWHGAQSPHWDGTARGTIVGWRASHSRAHMYRALLEGIAFEVRKHIDVLESAAGIAGGRILCTGGGSRSSAWMGIIAAVLERPLVICDEPETTALGAAIIAAVGAGIHPDLASAAAAMSRLGDEILATTDDMQTYSAIRPIQQNLYLALRPTFAAMSALR